MTAYCLGFAFTDYDNFVVLIRKNKPAWQKGLLNGVGGKIENAETSDFAMKREFKEETGIDTAVNDWKYVTRMNFNGVMVHVYATRIPHQATFESPTEEQIGLYSIIDVRNHPKIIPNLRWLVPMAMEVLDNPEDNQVPQVLNHE